MGKTAAAVAWTPVVEARVRGEPAFARGLLEEAVQALLDNELAVARNLIRAVIKGTVGYPDLSRLTGTPEKSLIRMFGPRGNPTAANLFNVIGQLQRRTGVQLAVRRVSPRRPPRRGEARAA